MDLADYEISSQFLHIKRRDAEAQRMALSGRFRDAQIFSWSWWLLLDFAEMKSLVLQDLGKITLWCYAAIGIKLMQ